MTLRQKSKEPARPKSKKNPEYLRLELTSRLPDMLTTAIESYERITVAPEEADAKSYTALHSAAKAALAHIESLLKLAKWAAFEDVGNTGPDTSLQQLIEAAKSAVADDGEGLD